MVEDEYSDADWILEDNQAVLAIVEEVRQDRSRLLRFAKKGAGVQERVPDPNYRSPVAAYVPCSYQILSSNISLKSKAERAERVCLVSIGNYSFDQVISTFLGICSDIQRLETHANSYLFPALTVYGEGEPFGGFSESDVQEFVARLLPTLRAVTEFVSKSSALLGNALMQIQALYHPSTKVMDVRQLHFQVLFENIASLLRCILTLDIIIDDQSTLHSHWLAYKRSLSTLLPDAERFNVPREQLSEFSSLLKKIESIVLDGNAFKTAVERIVGAVVGSHGEESNAVLFNEINTSLKNMASQLEMALNTAVDQDTSADPPHVLRQQPLEMGRKVCGLACLLVLFSRLQSQTIDRKLLRSIWGLHKKVPAVILYANVTWTLDEFFTRYLPPSFLKNSLDKRNLSLPEQQRNSIVNAGFSFKDVEVLSRRVNSWLISMSYIRFETAGDDHKEVQSLLLKGVNLAGTLSARVRTLVSLHSRLSRPMTFEAAICTCRVTTLLAMLRTAFKRHAALVATMTLRTNERMSQEAVRILDDVRSRIVSEGIRYPFQVDIASALSLCKGALVHEDVENCSVPPIQKNTTLLSLSLAVAKQGKTFLEDEAQSLSICLRTVEAFNDFTKNLAVATDCGFLLWHRILVGTYFDYVYQNVLEASRIQLFLSCLEDCLEHLRSAVHVSSREAIVEAFQEEIIQLLEEKILNPLCNQVETELRLLSHGHLELSDRNPFSAAKGSRSSSERDIRPLLELGSLQFLERRISVKGYVGHYLEKTFYNLTTVALHDWKSYGEMRTLAFHKFGLASVDPQLPSQTLEQGLDVLEIMRNIHIFVAKYAYNLNSQFFVERSSNSKHLNSIGIRQIANSIRTHGTGIMNTAVNFTYQFLKKKFHVFSEFLFDDHIKSRLIKMSRLVRETPGTSFPYDRAEKFNRGIRKLGLTADGLSYLDQFRVLITQIGNAMGYIRMIRSGGLHCCSEAAAFIPDLEGVTSFESLCNESSAFSPESVSTAKALDEVLGNINRNFSEGTEYFRLLVDAFAPAFRDPKNVHLRNFFVIVPPLTLNFVEHLLSAKERMSKRNKDRACFSDDGFSMGIAFIITLLNQHSEMASLHWFQTVFEKYKLENRETRMQQSRVMQEQQSTDGAKNRMATLTLTLQRLEVYEKEFQLLFYNLNSARIFFHSAPESAAVPPASE